MAKKKKAAPKPNPSSQAPDGCQQYRFSGKLWCDDHTDMYVGTKSHLVQFVASQDHPNAIKFKGEAKCCDYIYFVCWSNDSGLNGFIAELTGGNTVRTGDGSGWEVFATGINKNDSSSRPGTSQINSQILFANTGNRWVAPFVGSDDNSAGKPFTDVKSGCPKPTKFIWHNNRRDGSVVWPTSPFVPFRGFNHDEFLIFRFPANKMFKEVCQECDCCEETPLCNSACVDCAVIEESELTRFKNEKEFNVPGSNNGPNCKGAISGEPCRDIRLPNIAPCFYFHWGDSSSDQIESHDTEIVYITVCNPYNNVGFKKLTILNIEILPAQPLLPNGDPSIRITPSKLICFDCLDACCCASREFALITRGAKAQAYTINVEYCIEEVVLKNQNKGNTSFGITLVDS